MRCNGLVASVAVLGLLVGAGQLLAEAAPLGPVFEAAAATYNVPQDLLLVLGEMGSRFENRGTEPTIEGGYGIMGLRANAMGGDSLSLASNLTGTDAEQLKVDAGANILGAAAVLDSYAKEAAIGRKGIEDWLPVVIRYAGLDAVSSKIFAREFYERLQSGVSITNSAGESFVVPAHKLSLDPVSIAPSQIITASASQDYAGAIWSPLSCNYSTSVTTKDTVVVHTIEGTAAGAIAIFNNCSNQASSHYVVSESGTVWQLVPERNVAWHALCYNSRSVGIEHEGYAGSTSHPETLYEASAGLIRDICNRWGIPKEKARSGPGLVGHIDVTECGQCGTHWDPGPGWAWDHLVALVNQIGDRPSFIVESRSGGLNYGNYSEAGSWANSAAKSTVYGRTADIGSRYCTASGVKTATYRFTPSISGLYKVYATWPAAADATTQAEFIVTHSGGATSVIENERYDSANLSISNPCGRNNWNLLGEFTLLAGTQYTVTQTTANHQDGAIVRADAVKWMSFVQYNGPSIVQQPTGGTVNWGDNVSLSVVATGDDPLTYRWQKDRTNINDGTHYSGVTTPNLTIAQITQAEAGSYRCVVTDLYGEKPSNDAVITVFGKGFPPGDMDHDNDVDMSDFGVFQLCYTGSGVAQIDPTCAEAKLDRDSDVDANDADIFANCLSGPGNPARMDCGNP